MLRVFVVAAACLLLVWSVSAQDISVGLGIADVTGPVTQVNMMGYANPSQLAAGLKQRLFSRAFIFVDNLTGERAVFVNGDLWSSTQIVKNTVVARLAETYGSLYSARNVAIVGTHTHSGPAGYSEHVLLEFTSFGFIEDNFEAIVDGIYQSIVNAHNNIQGVTLYANKGELLNSGINRSPAAYERNPASERARYAHDTDKDMTLIKIVGRTGAELGSINWFAVHAVSLNNTNRLISGDNKGYAEYLFERDFGSPNGQGSFIAAFATANEADVSPNIAGPFCTGGPDQGLACDYVTSTCPNEDGQQRASLCHNRGPAGSNDRENTRIIGETQYLKAKELYASASQVINGRVYVRQLHVNMPNLNVDLGNGQSAQLCQPAMGFGFGAGTTDGPGFANFYQSDNQTDHPFWDRLIDFIKEPTPELVACQFPKPILLPTGEARLPHEWQPKIIDLQLFVIGDLVIIICPGELTTMAGRRLREAVQKILFDGGIISTNALVVSNSLANTYISYVTTFEEFQLQRYEGASTIYGPNTLAGIIQEFSRLAASIVTNTTVIRGPNPPDLSDRLISFAPLPKEDLPQNDTAFGTVKRDVAASYTSGQTVSVLFYGANLRNDFRRGSTFLTVEFLSSTGWTVVRTDNDWDTEIHWIPLHEDNAEQFISDVEIVWFTEASTAPGRYRIRYNGASRNADAVITPFVGLSSEFLIV